MVGSDHFHQLWLDNMPQFLVGKAPFYDANFHITSLPPETGRTNSRRVPAAMHQAAGAAAEAPAGV